MPTLTADIRDALRHSFQVAFGDRLDQLILYGSYARGEARSLSDVDVLVVLAGDVDDSDKERAYRIKHRLFDEYGKKVSPLVTSRERFDTYNQPLFRNVRVEGELLVPRDAPEAAAALRHHSYPPNIGPRGMKQPTEDALDRARQSLKSARVVLVEANDPNSAVSSAYYAMLHAARAALNEVDKAPKSHQGVQHQLRETYVEDGPLEVYYHSLLSRAEDKRLEADYEVSPSFTHEDAEQWIARAEEFVDTIETVLIERSS